MELFSLSPCFLEASEPSQSDNCELRAHVPVHSPCGEFYCCHYDFVSINIYCHGFIVISRVLCSATTIEFHKPLGGHINENNII